MQKNRSSEVEYSSLPSRANRTFFHQESSGEYSFLRSKESSRTVLRGSLFFYITCSIGGIILVDTSLRRDQLECADRTKSLSLSRGDLRQAACAASSNAKAPRSISRLVVPSGMRRIFNGEGSHNCRG